MYLKGSNQNQGINVPENYGGNAFRRGVYTDITPQKSGAEQNRNIYSADRTRRQSAPEPNRSRPQGTYDGTYYGGPPRSPYASSGIKEKTVQRDMRDPEEDLPVTEETPVLPSHDEISEKGEPKEKNDGDVTTSDALKCPSLFSSLFPSYDASDKFPFGHGLGSEELFIIGMMLLVYTSADRDEVDGELLLLLCILIFMG